MNHSHKLRRRFVPLLLLSFLVLNITLPAAQAGMIGTAQVAASRSGQEQREQLTRLLQREELAAQLRARGVTTEQVQARVAALSDREVSAIVGQLDRLPAGGDFLAIAAFLFLVLLATDIAGFTEIFPFVKRTVADTKHHP